MLCELERDETLAGFSTDYTGTGVIFETYSNTTVIRHERWNTWFCLYRSQCLHLVSTSHFYFEFILPNGMRYIYDSAGKFQADLITKHGLRFKSLPPRFQRSYIHYGASSKIKRRLSPRNVLKYRYVSLVCDKGLLYGSRLNSYLMVRALNRAVRGIGGIMFREYVDRISREKWARQPSFMTPPYLLLSAA